MKVQELRIAKGDSAEDIKTWTDKIEQELETWDSETLNAQKTTAAWKQREKEDEKLYEKEMAAKERHELFKESMEQKIQLERQMEKVRIETQNTRSSNAKLPKLVITKFNGTSMDWLRFWNQLQAEIDKANVAAVTKFSYLKELVDPKVRSCIDGLPFSTEGYERAKAILETRYGDTSEIVNAYVQNIMYVFAYHPRNKCR